MGLGLGVMVFIAFCGFVQCLINVAICIVIAVCSKKFIKTIRRDFIMMSKREKTGNIISISLLGLLFVVFLAFTNDIYHCGDRRHIIRNYRRNCQVLIRHSI